MTTDTDQQQAIERLRARVKQLEQELVDQAARSSRVVSEAQERLYWLDRWHVDLNELMRKPGAAEFRWLVRAVRAIMRKAKNLKRKLTSSRSL